MQFFCEEEKNYNPTMRQDFKTCLAKLFYVNKVRFRNINMFLVKKPLCPTTFVVKAKTNIPTSCY